MFNILKEKWLLSVLAGSWSMEVKLFSHVCSDW